MLKPTVKKKMIKQVTDHFERICFPLDTSKKIRVKSSEYGPVICFTYFILGIDKEFNPDWHPNSVFPPIKRLQCDREELFDDFIDIFVRTQNGDAESFLEDLNLLEAKK